MKKKGFGARLISVLFAILLALTVITGCSSTADAAGKGSKKESTRTETVKKDSKEASVTEDGEYDTKDEVALYLYLFGHLPGNYITKKEAKELGWDSSKGNLWDVAPGKSIGGDKFGNREGILPEKKKRQYYECDIDYHGGFRGANRIIYSSDGLIYYTEDHYETFCLLYGEE